MKLCALFAAAALLLPAQSTRPLKLEDNPYILDTQDNGDFVVVDYSKARDLYGRDDIVEKRAKSFDIDLGLCVFCGYCVEACPVDAIHMDANKVELAAYSRKDLIWNMRELLGDTVKRPSWPPKAVAGVGLNPTSPGPKDPGDFPLDQLP